MVHSKDFYKLYQKTFEEYTELYGQQVCVFLQKGSFYEMYGIYNPATDEQENTVKQVADNLGLKLNVYPKDAPDGKTGLFGGVPEDKINKWAGRLCEQGWTCVLIDQIKNDSNIVTSRKVARVLSPGTHTEYEKPDESMYVISVWLEAPNLTSPPFIGLAAIETTTGQIIHFEQETTGTLQVWRATSASQFISTFQPREVLVNWEGAPMFCPEEATLRINLDISSNVPLYIRIPANKDKFKDTYRETTLKKFLKPEGIMPIRAYASLIGYPKAEIALCELFSFIEGHDSKLVEKIQAPDKWNPVNAMTILNHAMEQLNIKSTISDFTVEKMFNRCLTAIGKRAFKQLLQSPYCRRQQIEESHNSINWILNKEPQERKNLEACLSSMCDIARLNRQVSKGELTHSSAQQLAITLESLLLLCRQLRDSPLYNDEVEEAITNSLIHFKGLFNWEKVMQYTSETNEFENWLQLSISENTEEALNVLLLVKKEADSWLREFEKYANLSEHTLEFKNTEATRYQVSITKTQHKAIGNRLTGNEKYSYKTMSSNVRVESTNLNIINDRTASAEERFKSAFQKDLQNACIVYCKQTSNHWKLIETWLAKCDIIISHTLIVEKYGLTKPNIVESENSFVSFENLRHPLIEAQKTRLKYTPHSVSLDGPTDGILLYGINASGKSSLMKAIGISVVLAQCGLYVPATYMELSPFKTLATRILNHDNIAQGMSSFTVEMCELREIIRIADNKTLVLGDEVCSGTESISATSIVAGTLEYLLNQKTKFIFATHLHDLMRCTELVESPQLNVFHLHCEYDKKTDTLIYDRQLLPGSGKTYYGLEVAKALHIPEKILEKAYKIRATLLGHSETQSHWNARHTVRSCEVCGSEIHSQLEVHHIQPRELSSKGRNQDGTATNSLRNLITVCQICHDKHHLKEIEIKELIQTSKGELRPVIIKKIIPKKKSEKTYTEEQLQIIRKCVVDNTGLDNKLIVVKLKEEYSIDLSAKELIKIISS